MADSLEDFLKEIRRNLASLPLDEQERRLDVVSVQLAEYMAVQMAQGIDEETAAREAIRQFEAFNSSALYPGVAGADGAARPSRFGPRFSPTTANFLYCVAATKAVACFFGFVFWLLANPLLPSVSSWVVIIGPKFGPSLFFAVVAGTLLLFRDGLNGMASTLTSSRTVAGTGTRWLVLRQAFLTALSLGLFITLRSAAGAGFTYISVLQQSTTQIIIGLALILLMPVAPFIAGWLTARDSPGLGVQGVTLAATTSAFLSLLDFCSWQLHAPGDTSLELRIALLLFLLLGQALLVGLAVAGARIGREDAKAQI